MTAISYPLAVASGTTVSSKRVKGRPFCLFMASAPGRDRWRSTVERFTAQGYRAIAFDLPGHGFASKEADGPCTVPQISSHLLALMDAMAIERAPLVGTSLGAHIVAHAPLNC